MRKLLLLALSASLITTASFAQQNQNAMAQIGRVAPNASSGTGQGNATGTREDILADPRITIVGRNIAVTEFTFSIKAQGMEYRGPFTVKGDKLPPNVIKILKDLETPQGMVYIESIKVIDENKAEQNLSPIIMKMVASKK
jgi:hypothetical protein